MAASLQPPRTCGLLRHFHARGSQRGERRFMLLDRFHRAEKHRVALQVAKLLRRISARTTNRPVRVVMPSLPVSIASGRTGRRLSLASNFTTDCLPMIRSTCPWASPRRALPRLVREDCLDRPTEAFGQERRQLVVLALCVAFNARTRQWRGQRIHHQHRQRFFRAAGRHKPTKTDATRTAVLIIVYLSWKKEGGQSPRQLVSFSLPLYILRRRRQAKSTAAVLFRGKHL